MRHFNFTAIVLAIALTAALPVAAQVTLAGVGTPGLVEMSYLPTAAYPTGASPVPPLGGYPNASLLPPIVAGGLAGGMACDQRNAWVYTTNGQQMAIDIDPNFLPFGLTPAPPVAGFLPVPLPAGLGPITGLGFDDAAQILWACDGAQFFGLNPLPPYNLIVPALPIPLTGAPASGLGYDPCDGTLWACDTQGGIYHFDLAGAPIGAQPVSIVPTPIILGGLTVATHNGAGAIPAPGCSTQIPGYHVMVQDGMQVYDAFGAAPPLPFGPFGLPYGLASSADYQITNCASPFPTCPSSGSTPFAGMGQPLISSGFNTLHLTGATPSTPAILLVDFCPQLPCWLGLMMNPFTWSALPTFTDGFGDAQFGFFAGGFPKGFQFSFQWAVQDPLAPLGYCFSNLSTQTVGAP
jgi:hypothetical protein